MKNTSVAATIRTGMVFLCCAFKKRPRYGIRIKHGTSWFTEGTRPILNLKLPAQRQADYNFDNVSQLLFKHCAGVKSQVASYWKWSGSLVNCYRRCWLIYVCESVAPSRLNQCPLGPHCNTSDLDEFGAAVYGLFKPLINHLVWERLQKESIMRENCFGHDKTRSGWNKDAFLILDQAIRSYIPLFAASCYIPINTFHISPYTRGSSVLPKGNTEGSLSFTTDLTCAMDAVPILSMRKWHSKAFVVIRVGSRQNYLIDRLKCLKRYNRH